MVVYGKGPKGKAGKLHSQIIRTIGMCERCGGNNVLQCAHILSRRYTATYTDLRNAFCLCAACHRYFTDHPVNFGDFVRDSWAKVWYDDLTARAHRGQKATQAFWQDRVEFLTDILDRIQEGELTLMEAREYEKWTHGS